jgi:sigma-E factor negative regulatory protein RseC
LIEQQGKVIRVVEDRIHVRIGGLTGCSACDAGKGCGAGVFGKLLRRKPVVMEFDNEIDARDGQAVVVGLKESVFLALVVRLYLFPLLAGLAGAITGNILAGGLHLSDSTTDWLVLAAAVVFAGVAVLLIRSRPVEFPGDAAVHVVRIGQCEVFE